MSFLSYFNSKTIKYDLINKFHYNKTKTIPKLKKVILNFGCNNNKLKNLSSSLLALELITSKSGELTTTKQSNILLKIRKGNPVGCKVILRNNQMFNFLERFISEILPKIKNLDKSKVNNTSFSFELLNTFNFKELENNYYLFNELNKLNVTLVFTYNLKKELIFTLTSCKIIN